MYFILNTQLNLTAVMKYKLRTYIVLKNRKIREGKVEKEEEDEKRKKEMEEKDRKKRKGRNINGVWYLSNTRYLIMLIRTRGLNSEHGHCPFSFDCCQTNSHRHFLFPLPVSSVTPFSWTDYFVSRLPSCVGLMECLYLLATVVPTIISMLYPLGSSSSTHPPSVSTTLNLPWLLTGEWNVRIYLFRSGHGYWNSYHGTVVYFIVNYTFSFRTTRILNWLFR